MWYVGEWCSRVRVRGQNKPYYCNSPFQSISGSDIQKISFAGSQMSENHSSEALYRKQNTQQEAEQRSCVCCTHSTHTDHHHPSFGDFSLHDSGLGLWPKIFGINAINSLFSNGKLTAECRQAPALQKRICKRHCQTAGD